MAPLTLQTSASVVLVGDNTGGTFSIQMTDIGFTGSNPGKGMRPRMSQGVQSATGIFKYASQDILRASKPLLATISVSNKLTSIVFTNLDDQDIVGVFNAEGGFVETFAPSTTTVTFQNASTSANLASSGITPGVYALRASPVKGFGGMYATSGGPGKPVTLAAEGPTSDDNQQWALVPVDGQEDTYIIKVYHEGVDIVVFPEGWAVNGDQVRPDETVIVNLEIQQPMQVRLTPSKSGVSNAYVVRPVVERVGCQLVVGHTGNQLQTQAFPIEAEDLPYWQFNEIDMQ
ncbi:hypothetical protein HGRIS_003022 [Hohenbuehelia grisea]|uniref:Ricin B lectin domain-containing protein n=1 Tax=Hohenbuehelia grisea TaxID=104357 RepID=A0ABR3JNP4_9AGAR